GLGSNVPVGVTATPGNAQVIVAWNAVSGASSYNVKRSTTSGSGYTTVGSAVTGTSFTNTGLTNGTQYFYVVTATVSGVESGNSAEVTATPVAPPSAPTGLTATPGNAKVTLNWSAVSGATSYAVKRSLSSGTGYTTIATGNAGTNYVDTPLTNGTKYF